MEGRTGAASGHACACYHSQASEGRQQVTLGTRTFLHIYLLHAQQAGHAQAGVLELQRAHAQMHGIPPSPCAPSFPPYQWNHGIPPQDPKPSRANSHVRGLYQRLGCPRYVDAGLRVHLATAGAAVGRLRLERSEAGAVRQGCGVVAMRRPKGGLTGAVRQGRVACRARGGRGAGRAGRVTRGGVEQVLGVVETHPAAGGTKSSACMSEPWGGVQQCRLAWYLNPTSVVQQASRLGLPHVWVCHSHVRVERLIACVPVSLPACLPAPAAAAPTKLHRLPACPPACLRARLPPIPRSAATPAKLHRLLAASLRSACARGGGCQAYALRASVYHLQGARGRLAGSGSGSESSHRAQGSFWAWKGRGFTWVVACSAASRENGPQDPKASPRAPCRAAVSQLQGVVRAPPTQVGGLCCHALMVELGRTICALTRRLRLQIPPPTLSPTPKSPNNTLFVCSSHPLP